MASTRATANTCRTARRRLNRCCRGPVAAALTFCLVSSFVVGQVDAGDHEVREGLAAAAPGRGSGGGQAPQRGVHAPSIPSETSLIVEEGAEQLSQPVPIGRIGKNGAAERATRAWLRVEGYGGPPTTPKPIIGPGRLAAPPRSSSGSQSGAPSATFPSLPPPASSDEQQAQAPLFGGSFQGGTKSSKIPPDCAVAAGPADLVATTNDFVNVFTKNGTLVASRSQSLSQFFSPLGQVAMDGPFDPHVVYDQYIGRFWLIAAAKNGGSTPTRSTLLIALSDTSSAAGTWTFFSVNAALDAGTDSGFWCDYPQIGVDAQAVYFTCNMFDFGNPANFQYAKIRAMTKDQFVNDTGLFWWDFWNLRESELGVQASFTVQPAHMYGATTSNGEFLIDAHIFCVFCPPGTLEVWHLTNAQRCCTAGSQSAPDLNQQAHDVGNYPDPPGARQSGSGTRIDTGDTRLLYALWKDGLLSAGQNLGCSGDACIAFSELNVAGFPTISTVNDFAYSTSGIDYYYPAVDVNAAGNKTMVFGRSGPSEFAGTRYLGIPASSSCTNCTNGPEVVLQNGQNTYINAGCPTSGCPTATMKNRWGDYFGAAADPDGTGIWIHSEFASGTASGKCSMACATTELDQWTTQVGLTYEQLDTTRPTTVASLSPAANGAGWNRSTVTVTLVATDNAGGSGVKQITYSATGAQTISATTVPAASTSFAITAEGRTTIRFFARDNAGNVESSNTLIVQLDRTAPSLACGAADGLWHASDVSIPCTASDALSQLADPSSASFSLVTSVTAGTDQANAFTGSRVICDVAGNCVTAGPIGGNMVDKKAPAITITQPAATSYRHRSMLTLDYAVSDGSGSGVRTVTPLLDGAATVAGHGLSNGQMIDLRSLLPGLHVFSIDAVDNVGNADAASVTFTVRGVGRLLGAQPADGPGGGVAVSSDETVVGFYSDATNLIAHDTNAVRDAFVADRRAHGVERVSVSTGGSQANGRSQPNAGSPAISGDGHVVAFYSLATDLVSPDSNGVADVFVRNRAAGTTERISVSTAGTEANGTSISPSISGDGRFVAFQSHASNLVANDTNGVSDIFVRDRVAGTTERVCGVQGNGFSFNPCISADGRFVAFASAATNLVLGDTNGRIDIFVCDRNSGTIDRVSVASDGTQANRNSRTAAISGDGRVVAFTSAASNLVANDLNGAVDVFAHDRVTGTTERISVDTAGGDADDLSFAASISSDGRFVVFGSYASNLVSNDLNNASDVFVRDRHAGTTRLVDVNEDGQQATDGAGVPRPAISGDGGLVVFESPSSNLAGPNNGTTNIFLATNPFLNP